MTKYDIDVPKISIRGIIKSGSFFNLAFNLESEVTAKVEANKNTGNKIIFKHRIS